MPLAKIRLKIKSNRNLIVAVNAAMITVAMITVVIALAAIYTFVSKNVTFLPAAICRLKRCRSDENDCSDCKVRAFNALLEEYNMKQAHFDSQKVEIERLRQG
eukprot:scaffold2436_cov80-Skeletonema_dohrnii-CCMP3373.AAC.12